MNDKKLLEWFDFCIEDSKQDRLPRFYTPIEEKAIEEIRQCIQQRESLMSIDESLALVVSILEDCDEDVQAVKKISVSVVEKCRAAVEHVSIYNSNDRTQEAMAMVNNAFEGFEIVEEE